MLSKILIVLAIVVLFAILVVVAYIKAKLCEKSPCLQIRLNGSCPFDFKRSCQGCQYWDPLEEVTNENN